MQKKDRQKKEKKINKQNKCHVAWQEKEGERKGQGA